MTESLSGAWPYDGLQFPNQGGIYRRIGPIVKYKWNVPILFPNQIFCYIKHHSLTTWTNSVPHILLNSIVHEPFHLGGRTNVQNCCDRTKHALTFRLKSSEIQS